MTRNWLALPLTIALAACGGDGTGDGNGASISVKSGEGDASIKADKDGRVAIKAPGFEGSIKLPKFDLDAGNFEVDGLKLYPGSTIANLDVDANRDKGGEDTVRVKFDSPAAADQVRKWFQEQMQAAGFTVAAKDGELSGKTSEGSDFTLKLDSAGDAKSQGTLTVLGK